MAAALRRWEPFLAVFTHIDAAIEAAAGPGSRAAFRRERDRIVDALRLCDDAAAAEEIGALLDAAMAESLVTLSDAVPASAAKAAIASGKVVAALGTLIRGHCCGASARVRGIACDVVQAWKAGVEEEVATARAALHVLGGVVGDDLVARKQDDVAPVEMPPKADLKKAAKKQAEIVWEGKEKPTAYPKKPAAAPIVVGSFDAKAAKPRVIPVKKLTQADVKKPAKKEPEIILEEGKRQAYPKKPTAAGVVGGSFKDMETKVPDPKRSEPRKTGPVVGCARVKASASTEIPPPTPPKKTGGASANKKLTMPVNSRAEETKMEATKRKLHERYQDAEDAKRRRTIQVIKAPPPQKTKTQMQGRTTQPAVMRARGHAPCSSSERRFLASSLPRV